MNPVEITQWLGTLGVVAFYPIQNWRLFLTRNPVGLSFLAFFFIAVGVSGYFALGLHLGLFALTLGNLSNLLFTILILSIIWFRSPTLGRKERLAGIAVILVGLGILGIANLAASPEFARSLSGWVGLLGVVSFYPIQNAKLFQSKNPTGLSLLAFASITVGLAFYTWLGFLVSDITLILGNGLTCLGSILIVSMILRYRKQSLAAA